MTAPAGPEYMTLEEIEEQQNAPAPVAPPKLEDIKLEGDNVPELLRGKSAADALKTVEAMGASLKISEAARQAAEANARSFEQRSKEPEKPEPAAGYDREKFREMYDQDPVAAIEEMGNYLAAQMQQSMQTRLEPLAHGVSSAAEQYARTQYGEEFELFGDQITNFAQSLPDKTVLATKKGWDDLVSYIRGQPENFNALVAKKTSPITQAAAQQARQQQVAGTGFTAPPVPSAIPATGSPALDDSTKRIAQTFIDSGVFKDEAEYVKWMQKGG